MTESKYDETGETRRGGCGATRATAQHRLLLSAECLLGRGPTATAELLSMLKKNVNIDSTVYFFMQEDIWGETT